MAQRKQSIHSEAGMHRKLVLFAVQLEGYLCHFPNCHKYTLTQSIRQAFIDVYNLVTEAQKRYHKKTTLTQLDIRHEQLRMLINLAHELGLAVNAGHGLNYVNIAGVRPLPHLHELNIGHSILSRALFTGLGEAVREMKRLMADC